MRRNNSTQRPKANWAAGFKITALALIAGTMSGCAVLLVGGAVAAGAAAGVGAAAYTKGELHSVESASLVQAWAATPAAMKDYGVAVVDKSKNDLNASIEGRSPDNTKIMVRLKNTGKQTTEVRIRVGTFGNETISRQILEAMRKHYAGSASQSSAAGRRGAAS